MPDEMFFTPDRKALRRGKRRARRTETCRPCLVWPKDAPEIKVEGVVLNMNPFGVMVRMLNSMPVGMQVAVQLMRDEDFEFPLAAPMSGEIRRNEQRDGFVDHGIRFEQKEIKRYQELRPVRIERPRLRPARRPRMHTIDITLGGPAGRTGR